MNHAIIAATAAAGLALAGCTPIGVGTGTGALLGGIAAAALGGNVQQVAIGTLLGGAAGFVIASVVQAQGKPAGVCQAVNQFGQRIYVTAKGGYVTYQTPTPLLVKC